MATAKGARTSALWGTNLLQQNQGQVLQELADGQQVGQRYLGQAGDVWKGLTNAGQPGLDRYNLLTLGGPGAQEALEATPGYSFAFDQGNQALTRARAAQGMLASGNTDVDAIKFGQGLAGQTLTQERQALLPYLSMFQQGTAGQAGTYGAQAGLATDYYGNRASVLDNTTKSIVGLGTEALKAGDQAKSQNQANMLNAGMAGVKLLTGLATGGLGGGLGGGFTSLFGGGGGTVPGTGGLINYGSGGGY